MENTNQDLIRKAVDIVARHTVHSGLSDTIPFCALAMLEEDGSPTVAAITAARAEGLNWVTFSTGLHANKTKRLAKSNRAAVCFLSESYNVSLMGTLEVLTEPAVKRDAWYEALRSHFSGPEDPEYCVLRLTAKSYNILIDWQELRGTL